MTHSLVSSVTLLGSGFQHVASSVSVSNGSCPRWLTTFSCSSRSRLIDWLTDWLTVHFTQLTPNNYPAYNISARNAQKTPFLGCCAILAFVSVGVPISFYPILSVETWLFAEPLLSNDCCIFAYLAIVAQQWVYMPQYKVAKLCRLRIRCCYLELPYELVRQRIFKWPNPSSRIMALGSTQPLTEMSTRVVKGGRRVGLTTLPPSVSQLSRQNVGTSTSHNPMGLHNLLQR
jgi:hypothetical protein